MGRREYHVSRAGWLQILEQSRKWARHGHVALGLYIINSKWDISLLQSNASSFINLSRRRTRHLTSSSFDLHTAMVRKHVGWPSRARQDDTSSTPNPNNGAAHAAIGRSFQLDIASSMIASKAPSSAQRERGKAQREQRPARRNAPSASSIYL
jgi:hypothetical protein